MEQSKETEAAGANIPPQRYTINPTRLNIVIAGLWISLFLSALDTTIVTTALIKISSDFNSFSDANWLLVAYLLTYNAFLLITTKLSDNFGSKAMLLICNVFFLVFSMACGAAKTMNQLIIFRALQGIGGSGQYALVFVVIMQLVSFEKIGLYSGIISSVFALANLLGPVLGGIIADHTTWRWIFYLNGPLVGISILILGYFMPNSQQDVFQKEKLERIDWVGGALSIGWAIPLIFALQEGGTRYPWNSSAVIGTLTGGCVGIFVFGFYEACIEKRENKDPIFPIKFIKEPIFALLLLNSALMGSCTYAAMIGLPQRFQAVNGVSASRAGILLLCLTLVTPISSVISGVVMNKRPTWAEYIIPVGCSFMSIGIGLVSNLSLDHPISAAQFGYEVLIGLGFGLISPTSYFILRTHIDEVHLAAATGALNMVRTVGGCIGIAICSAILHSSSSELNQYLASLGPDVALSLRESFAYLEKLPADTVKQIRQHYGRSYNQQFQVILGLALANVVVSVLLVWFRLKNLKSRGGIQKLLQEEMEQRGGIMREREVVTEAIESEKNSS